LARPLAALLFALPIVTGCAHLAVVGSWDPSGPAARLVGRDWGDDGALPRRTELVAGQLVIHADFSLAGQHRLVRELEAMRADVSQELGLPISDEPVHLYLFENPVRYEAFVAARFPAFPARRAFFVETDTTLSVFAAWQDRIAEDLRHETTHGYVHAVVPAIPLWLDEGIAEYFELPGTEQGRHAAHLAHLSGRIIEGTWRPDMERLESLEKAGEMSQDHYAEAWCWVHWLLTTTPQRRTLLQEYLADVRRDPATAPLSVRLRRTAPADLAAELRGHVEGLTDE
jgi:hypothetical protein